MGQTSSGEQFGEDVMKILLADHSCGTLILKTPVQSLHLHRAEPETQMNNQLTNQLPNPPNTQPQNYQTTQPPNHKTTQLGGHTTNKPQNHPSTQPQTYPVAWQRLCIVLGRYL